MSSADHTYEIYGLTLQSPLLLPCPRASRARKPDIQLRPGTALQFARAHGAEPRSNRRGDWFQHQQLADGTRYLRWTGLFEFLISGNGRRIVYRPLKNGTPESFHVYLLGQVLSFSLLAIGAEALHGTVVTVDDAAVALLGNCGRGKSTLAAALLARGFPILTDDLIVPDQQDDGWSVHPGIPRLKLFPSMARRVLGRDGGTPMNDSTSKLVLPLGASETARSPVSLKALYVLSDPKESKVPTTSVVHIEHLSGQAAFLEVIKAAFNLIVLDRHRLANQFAFATRLTASVPVRRLHYPRRVSILPAVCDALLADLAAPTPDSRLAMVS